MGIKSVVQSWFKAVKESQTDHRADVEKKEEDKKIEEIRKKKLGDVEQSEDKK